MKKLYVLLFAFLIKLGFSQDSKLYYDGSFYEKDNVNKPYKFIKIANKNSGNYELTNAKGYLIIEAKAGDTLVWNNGKNFRVVYSVSELKTILLRRISNDTADEIYSKDYQQNLLKIDSSSIFSIENAKVKLSKKSDLYFNEVRKLNKENDTLFTIKKLKKLTISFNGSYSGNAQIKVPNALPKLQNEFVQGRSQNGNLVWRGAETGEVFSFGPSVSSLSFDENAYEYDDNGRLVALNSVLKPATSYNNNLTKPIFGYSNFLNLNSLYKVDGSEKISLKLKLGQTKEPLYFSDEYSLNNQFSGVLSGNLKYFKANFSYQFSDIKATNSDRAGFYNRVFQNSLLTPISFSNKQKSLLNNGLQRSFSPYNDNPYFLLDDGEKYRATSKQHLFSLEINKTFFEKLKINLNGNLEKYIQHNFDFYKPYTAFFPLGISDLRSQNFETKSGIIGANYTFGDYDFRNNIYAKYILNNQDFKISHAINQKNYHYQRLSNEFILNYVPEFNIDEVRFYLDLSNNFYSSNTSSKSYSWLPKANAKITFDEVFNSRMSFDLFGGFARTTQEAAMNFSHSNYLLTNYFPANNLLWFPVIEISDYKNLQNIDKTKWNAGISFRPFYRLVFNAEYFKHNIVNDVFPVFENQELKLKNLANHIYEGWDFSANYKDIFRSYKFRLGSSVSFFKYRDVVTNVENGYNLHPIVGFGNIYKGLSEGNDLGSIVGTYYLRDASGNKIIGNDGFPIKSNDVKVLGSTIPDFTMKFGHQLDYKKVSLNINWEWRRGGKVWNGTQAMLDYYGRSQTSADERNIKNYVFGGVNSSGNPNTVAVDFYNPNLDVYQNRWTRYGMDGVAEDYLQEGDFIRINDISISTWFNVPNNFNKLKLTAYVSNILIWRKYGGVDSSQSFYQHENGQGLDFFNLPAFSTLGFNVSYEF